MTLTMLLAFSVYHTQIFKYYVCYSRNSKYNIDIIFHSLNGTALIISLLPDKGPEHIYTSQPQNSARGQEAKSHQLTLR